MARRTLRCLPVVILQENGIMAGIERVVAARSRYDLRFSAIVHRSWSGFPPIAASLSLRSTLMCTTCLDTIKALDLSFSMDKLRTNTRNASATHTNTWPRESPKKHKIKNWCSYAVSLMEHFISSTLFLVPLYFHVQEMCNTKRK
jgi:hypothetical protein